MTHAELRAAAEAAVESWNEAGVGGHWYVFADFRKVKRGEKPIAPPEPVDAAYIALASPDVVLGLLDENAALVAALEIFADAQHGGDVWGRYCAEVHDLARTALASVKGEDRD